ncbi:hypothetical protein SAMN02745136_00496 [Anaerocolumna jejuensis DSM 15929]|uniref:Uncharacterized protein n=1 Tax=Anaerocolumna jejuensis DSM 15929 TaxID=1121322 RepID=A0A1M6KLM3_9FIRM|nr:hypothetical protein [Anaerocolumna jejuensis]SHJ59804.1 hypothetical protein SAMN02745136_00496 [Anaerocolumna jejuensis DSM 15929]
MVTSNNTNIGPVGILIMIVIYIFGIYNSVNANELYLNCNDTVVYAEGTTAGNLGISNRTHKTVQAVIYREDTKIIIYKSAMLPKGGFVDSDKLGIDLEPGTYDCKVAFQGLNSSGSVVTLETKDMQITIQQ